MANLRSKVFNFLKHPLFSGSMIMVGGNMVVNGINYFYHLIMGRILGPADYGILASIFSLFYIISIVPASSSFAIVKFISEAKNDSERQSIHEGIKKFVWIIAVAGTTMIVLLSPLVQNFLHIKDILTVVFVGPVFFLSLVVLVEQAALQGVLKFTGVVLPNLVSAVGKLVLGLILIYLGFSVTGAVGAVVLASLLTYWTVLILSKNLFNGNGSGSFQISVFLRYAFPVLLQALSFTSIFTVDVLLAKHFLPAFDAGLYAALSTLGKIIFFATQPIAATMFPIVSGRRSRGEKYKTIFLVALMVTVVVTLAIIAAYYFWPGIAIGLLYGKAYLSASTELVWMGAFIGTFSLASLIVNFLLSINRTKIVVIPVLAAMAQVIGIVVWHQNILQIIQVSFAVTLALFGILALYLFLEWSKRSYSLS